MALNIPGAAVRPLSEDDLKTAKEVLVARAASASRVPPEKIAQQLAVAAGEWVPAFQVAVQSFLEMRTPKLEPVTRPFKDGMSLPDVPAPLKEPFDVWSFPVEPRKDYSAQKTVVPVLSTLEKKDCTVCLGKGAAPCKSCFAKGVVNCDACMGAGSQPCGICKGLSKISCPDCEGTGKVKAGGMTNKTLGPCGSCGGAGKFNCNHCSGGKVDCGTCGNSGKKSCPTCAGKGRMECATCGGSTKVVTGMGFTVEYRPQQASTSGMGAPAPQGVLEMALSKKSAPISADFPSGDDLKKILSEDGVSPELRAAIEQAADRLKPAGTSARLGPTRLSVVQGGVWRVMGAFSGHDFIYWIHPDSKSVVPEKDSLKEVGQKSADTAQQALGRGDWEVAVDAARETLTLDPSNPEASAIAARWKRKLLQESILLGGGAGVLGAAAAVIPVFAAQKGLHRMGPAVLSGGAVLAVGLAAGLALLPVARRLFPTKKRLSVMGGSCLGAVLAFFVVAKGFIGWNPIRNADQRALDAEMQGKFNATIYNEEDYAALQALYDRYKDSQADLVELNRRLQSQITLKGERDAMAREFASKLDELMAADMFLPDKRAKVLELKDHYALANVDVSAADKALRDMDEQIQRAAATSHSKPAGHISITPLHPAASTRRVHAVSGRSHATAHSTAKPSSKTSAAKKKRKGVKPNQEIDPRKKKHSFFSGSSSTVD